MEANEMELCFLLHGACTFHWRAATKLENLYVIIVKNVGNIFIYKKPCKEVTKKHLIPRNKIRIVLN
jgi:hypothetical protein